MKNSIITYIFGLFMIVNTALGTQNESNIFTYNLGDTKVHLLSEGQKQGDSDLLIGATENMIENYTNNGKFDNAVNAFLIQTKDENILIDTGFGINLFENLEKFNLKADDIKIILITHMHGDHIGGLLRNGEKTFKNAIIYLPDEEVKYWTNNNIKNSFPLNKQSGFENAQKILKIYEGKTKLFTPNDLNKIENKILSGVYPIKSYGHTPGHTSFLIDSDGQKLLIWGDLTHAMQIQMPYPNVALIYDIDPQMAIKTRKEILEYVAKNNIIVAGMHIAYPAIGNIEEKILKSEFKDFKSYEFIPAK